MELFKNTRQMIKHAPPEPTEAITPLNYDEVARFPTGEMCIIRNYIQGQTIFYHRMQSDSETEAVIFLCTKLPDGNVVTPQNWNEMGWCPNCGNPRMKSSIRYCFGCGEEGCKVCIAGKKRLCKKCERKFKIARFLIR